MFVYMGMIEQRDNELLQARIYIQSKNQLPHLLASYDDSSEEENKEQMPMFNPEGASSKDDDDEDDVDLFSVPLNQEALMMKFRQT